MMNRDNKSGGYIAIASVLVILAVVLTLTMSGALLSIDGAQVSLSESKNQISTQIIESCAHEVLLELSNAGVLPTSITLPEGLCSVTLDSHLDNNWVFTVDGTVDEYASSIKIDVDRTSGIIINSWLEN